MDSYILSYSSNVSLLGEDCLYLNIFVPGKLNADIMMKKYKFMCCLNYIRHDSLAGGSLHTGKLGYDFGCVQFFFSNLNQFSDI